MTNDYELSLEANVWAADLGGLSEIQMDILKSALKSAFLAGKTTGVEII